MCNNTTRAAGVCTAFMLGVQQRAGGGWAGSARTASAHWQQSQGQQHLERAAPVPAVSAGEVCPSAAQGRWTAVASARNSSSMASSMLQPCSIALACSIQHSMHHVRQQPAWPGSLLGTVSVAGRGTAPVGVNACALSAEATAVAAASAAAARQGGRAAGQVCRQQLEQPLGRARAGCMLSVTFEPLACSARSAGRRCSTHQSGPTTAECCKVSVQTSAVGNLLSQPDSNTPAHILCVFTQPQLS